MKKLMFVAVLLASTMAYATMPLNVIEDDFESYADNAALNSAWASTANVTLSLELADVHSGDQAMEYTYNNGADPWYSKAEYILPGAVWGTSGEDWRGYDALAVHFKVTDAAGYLRAAIVDCWGNSMLIADYDGTNKTPVGEWTQWDIDITGLTDAELYRVGRIDLLMKPIDYGAGVILFDDIGLIPEPATIALLGLGALALLRRKKS